MRITPLILAGGLGTRMLPRTDIIPKPMIRIAGHPLLWYVFRTSLCAVNERPIVTIGHKSEIISEFFTDDPIDFVDLPGRTMAEVVFEIAEKHDTDAFLCMSSDVLIPSESIVSAVKKFRESNETCRAVFTKLPAKGHKKWNFKVNDGYLTGLDVEPNRTHFERVALIFDRNVLREIGNIVSRPVTKESLPIELRQFNTGWTFLLKLMLAENRKVAASINSEPVYNVNTPTDLIGAEKFVKKVYGPTRDPLDQYVKTP